jgi:hypothetical protein
MAVFDTLNFMVAGGLLAALIAVVQRTSWKRSMRLAVALLPLALVLMWGYISIGPRTLGEAPWVDHSPWKELLSFVLMLLGMVARYLTQAIEARRAKIDALAKKGKPFDKPRLELDGWEFAYPFLVCVITYGALVTQMSDARMNVATVTLCFQFGFFWQTVLGAKAKAA